MSQGAFRPGGDLEVAGRCELPGVACPTESMPGLSFHSAASDVSWGSTHGGLRGSGMIRWADGSGSVADQTAQGLATLGKAMLPVSASLQ
jgi:hypothetical protein